MINVQIAGAYDVPSRKIEVKPYLGFIFPSSLVEDAEGYNYIEDKAGFGFGLKVRTQFGCCWGFMLNASVSDMEASSEEMNSATIFTTGGYYTIETGPGNFTLDCGIGILAGANKAALLLMPSLEFNRPLSERTGLALELGWPIANDWFYSTDIEENFSSLTLSAGVSFIF